MYCDLVNVQPRFTLVSNEIIIKVILNLEEVISVAPYLTDKGEHTALYKINNNNNNNNNVYIKPQE